MTSGSSVTLLSSDPKAVIVFNPQTWIPENTILNADDPVLVESDIDTSFLACQLLPPLVLTTNTSFIGACTYKSGSASSTVSPIFTKNGKNIVLQKTIDFKCTITVQPINPSSVPDAEYPMGADIDCTCAITSDQTKLRASD